MVYSKLCFLQRWSSDFLWLLTNFLWKISLIFLKQFRRYKVLALFMYSFFHGFFNKNFLTKIFFNKKSCKKHTLKLLWNPQLNVCVSYFSLFLKEQCVSWLLRTKYFEKKFNLQLFYLPSVSLTFVLSWASTRYPPP